MKKLTLAIVAVAVAVTTSCGGQKETTNPAEDAAAKAAASLDLESSNDSPLVGVWQYDTGFWGTEVYNFIDDGKLEIKTHRTAGEDIVIDIVVKDIAWTEQDGNLELDAANAVVESTMEGSQTDAAWAEEKVEFDKYVAEKKKAWEKSGKKTYKGVKVNGKSFTMTAPDGKAMTLKRP